MWFVCCWRNETIYRILPKVRSDISWSVKAKRITSCSGISSSLSVLYSVTWLSSLKTIGTKQSWVQSECESSCELWWQMWPSCLTRLLDCVSLFWPNVCFPGQRYQTRRISPHALQMSHAYNVSRCFKGNSLINNINKIKHKRKYWYLMLSFHSSQSDLFPLESWKPSCSSGRNQSCSDHKRISLSSQFIQSHSKTKLTWTAAESPRPLLQCPHTDHCVISDTETGREQKLLDWLIKWKSIINSLKERSKAKHEAATAANQMTFLQASKCNVDKSLH